MPKVRVIGPIDDELRDVLNKLLEDAGCEVLDDLSADVTDDAEEDPTDDAEEDPTGIAVEETEEEPLPVEGAPASESSPECDEDAGIVVLSPKCLADGSLERIMQGAAARGCHVVGVWPPGTEAQNLPRPFEDYGGDTIVWDPGCLRDAISKPNAQPAWSLPDGQPRPERPLKRNKC